MGVLWDVLGIVGALFVVAFAATMIVERRDARSFDREFPWHLDDRGMSFEIPKRGRPKGSKNKKGVGNGGNTKKRTYTRVS